MFCLSCQFVLTKDEIEGGNKNWLTGFKSEIKGCNEQSSYKNLISLLVGSHYLTFQTPTHSPWKHIMKTKDLILKNAELKESQKLPDLRVKLDDIKRQSLGRIENILFWNDEQLNLYNSLKQCGHSILAGTYGSGKTVIAAAVADYFHDHTEIEDVHFLSALDLLASNRKLSKQTEDVFDLVMQKRFPGTAKFVCIAEMRRNLGQEMGDDVTTGNLTTFKLLLKYLRSIKNKDKSAVIIDELDIGIATGNVFPYNEVGKQIDSASSGLDEIFQCLREDFKVSVTVVGTSSLLDQTTHSIPRDEFRSFIRRLTETGYRYFELKKNMRNAQSVTSATSVSSVNQWLKLDHVIETIESGNVSTVEGPQSTCILYNMTNFKKIQTPESKLKVLAECIKMYLDKIKIDVSKTELKVVIIVLWEAWAGVKIGSYPKLLSQEIVKIIGNCKILSFDDCCNQLDDQEIQSQKNSVLDWLENGGLLVTSIYHFRGCEADIAIVVAPDFPEGVRIRGHRQAVTRGVAQICLICGDSFVYLEELSKHFDVLFSKN